MLLKKNLIVSLYAMKNNQKLKKKSYEGKVNKNLYNDKMPKCHCTYLSVVLIDSVFKMDKNYFLQVLLEKFNYNTKEEEAARHITDDLEISFDEENSGEK